MSAGDRLRVSARRVWRWFFPEEVELPAEARRILRAVYPTLDLEAVSFHRGTPHLVRLIGSHAITIPALLSPRRTRVYFEMEQWKPGTLNWLGTLVHEAFHALQVQESRPGFGPVRPFIILYFACGAANGFRYHGHPLEMDAFHVAGRRRSLFESTFAWQVPAPETVEERAALLATPSSGIRFWRQLAGSIPGVGKLVSPSVRRLWPAVLLCPLPLAFWSLLWTGAASLVWIGRLLIETAGASAAGLLWVTGALVSLPRKIFGGVSRRGKISKPPSR